MAVISWPEPNSTMSTKSAQGLFYGLFFGVGGGMLFFIIFMAVIYWRYGYLGRIRLGAIGPGELDDEQRLLEEETAGLQHLDPSQQEAYYGAKGRILTCIE